MKSSTFVALLLVELPRISQAPLECADIARHPDAIFRAHATAPVYLKIGALTATWITLVSGLYTKAELEIRSLYDAPCGWQWSLDNGRTWQRAVKYVDQHGNPIRIIRSN